MPEPTMNDWIARARAGRAEERAPALARAAALASTDSDYRALAGAYSELLNDRDAARRSLVRATEIDPQQVWCFGDLATLLRDAFADPEGALATLAQAEANLTAPGELPPGYRWRQLAELYRAHGGSETAIRGVLDKGTERACSVADYCTMADGYAELLGEETRARKLLARAEKLAEETVTARGTLRVHGWWTIANTYKSGLGDAAGARRSIERGLAMAEDVEGCATMATAWSSHATGDQKVTRACLHKGEKLAATTEHWLALAEAYHGDLGDALACKRCLERAATGAEGDQLRRVAHGYRHWLGDVEMAERMAPRGVAPEDLAAKRRDLIGWQADAGGLLRWLCARATSEVLEAIASADYFTGRDENLAMLGDIVETGLVPAPLPWNLHEVAALCRWSDGERVDHVERGLACTLLCLDFVQPTGYTEDIVSTVPALVESCLELGAEALSMLLGALVWLLETNEPADQPAHESSDTLAAQYGLLLTQVALDPADPRLVALARSTVTIERALANEGWLVKPERGWLNRVLCGLRDDKWRQLTSRLLDPLDADQFAHLVELRSLMAGAE